MEVDGSSSNVHQNDSSRGSDDASKNNLTEKEAFANHAEIAWNQMRQEWVGDQSKKLRRPPKDSTISLTASYEDMLLSKEPFQLPIPLSEMVRFFVQIWHEDGLYELGDR